ncbi:hypothetical protein AA313_de0201396 [Arthrobotrys entomopaga]|nr:hypothetical protein AA313_de0201396 [Arthrobotrys entomopaga]
MAKQLKGVEVDYCFFAAYLQKNTEEEMSEVNGKMLRNFLDALDITGASKKLKRVILTTGCKQYGVHLGQVKCPMEESDPWLDGPGRPPNFYYTQQRILAEKSNASGSYDWVVTYPNDVIGVAQNNFMNLASSLGLYCVVSKEVGDELIFPGSEFFYTAFDCFTDSRLHAEFNLWAAETSKCGNQAFNVVNGDAESWQNLWPKIAKHFNCHIPPNQFKADSRFEELKMKLEDRAPIDDMAATLGLEGATFSTTLDQKIDLEKWSQDRRVIDAWKRVQQRHGLDEGAFGKATWNFLGFVLGRDYNIVISMAKARKLGWVGYIDNYEAFDNAFNELQKLKVLPPRD